MLLLTTIVKMTGARYLQMIAESFAIQQLRGQNMYAQLVVT